MARRRGSCALIGRERTHTRRQTIFHVHVHIIPRRPGDFERNDDVYRKVPPTLLRALGPLLHC